MIPRSTNLPHSSTQNWIYDDASGDFRMTQASDFSSSASTNINPTPVKISGPSASAFGQVSVTQNSSEIEAYASSALDHRVWQIFTGQNDGYVEVGSGQAHISIGAKQFAYSTLMTKEIVPYSPGEGVVARFTAGFNEGVANSLQLVGVYHAEDGFGVGYNGENFGIFHRYGRKLEVQKLSFSIGSNTAGTVKITLNGTDNYVDLHGNNDITADARNIDTGKSFYTENGPLNLEYEHKTAVVSGDVYFYRNTHGPTTGTYAFDAQSTNASAAFSVFQQGALGTTDWTYQTGFSADKLNGNGPSAMTINPQKLNVYEIKYGWLGTLPIKFSIANESCQEIIPIHIISWTNQQTVPHVEDPRFPISYAIASSSSTTPMTLVGASAHATIEGGRKTYPLKQFSIIEEQTATTTETPIVSISNNRFNLRNKIFNRRRVFVESINISNESTNKIVQVRICSGRRKNLTGFMFYNPLIILDSNLLIDVSATRVEPNEDLLLIRAEALAPTSTAELKIDKYIYPDDVLIITILTSSSTANCVCVVNGYEDV